MNVVVGGGRHISAASQVWASLDSLHSQEPIERLAHGACEGADTIAAEWAQARGVVQVPYPALWETEGRAAGPIRNGRMLKSEMPDCVVVFPGGKGTRDLVRQARMMGLRVVEFSW